MKFFFVVLVGAAASMFGRYLGKTHGWYVHAFSILVVMMILMRVLRFLFFPRWAIFNQEELDDVKVPTGSIRKSREFGEKTYAMLRFDAIFAPVVWALPTICLLCLLKQRAYDSDYSRYLQLGHYLILLYIAARLYAIHRLNRRLF